MGGKLPTAVAVQFTGPIHPNGLTSYFSLCDVFLMPNRVVDSDVDGFGLVYIEAALCGKPAIELLSNPSLARQVGAAGRDRALAEFDYPIVAPRLRSAFPDTLKRPRIWQPVTSRKDER